MVHHEAPKGSRGRGLSSVRQPRAVLGSTGGPVSRRVEAGGRVDEFWFTPIVVRRGRCSRSPGLAGPPSRRAGLAGGPTSPPHRMVVHILGGSVPVCRWGWVDSMTSNNRSSQVSVPAGHKGLGLVDEAPKGVDPMTAQPLPDPDPDRVQPVITGLAPPSLRLLVRVRVRRRGVRFRSRGRRRRSGWPRYRRWNSRTGSGACGIRLRTRLGVWRSSTRISPRIGVAATSRVRIGTGRRLRT
jgi:hypothetical protein